MAKSWDVEGLEPAGPLIEGVRRIIQTKFREAFFFREAVIANIDREAVHDMRVSLRRLWAAMRIFGNCFEHDPGFERLLRKTRKLARRLGDVRDLDVLIEMLQTKSGLAPSNTEQAALTAIVEHCQKQRNKKYQKLLEYFQKLGEEQFEEEFLSFFAPDHDSSLTVATTGY